MAMVAHGSSCATAAEDFKTTYKALERRAHVMHQHLQRTQELVETLGTVAGMAKLYGEANQYEEVRNAALEVIQAHHDMKLYQDALIYLGSPGNSDGYQGKAEESTDFEQLVGKVVEKLRKEERQYDPEKDPLMDSFNKSVLAMAPDSNPEVIDDDIIIEGGGVQKNEKCPFTMKSLVDLEDPVEDANGFVYEKKPLMRYLRGGSRESPFAETNHVVHARDIKPAAHILAAKKRREGH